MGLVQDCHILHTPSLMASLKLPNNYETLDAQYKSDGEDDDFFNTYRHFPNAVVND